MKHLYLRIYFAVLAALALLALAAGFMWSRWGDHEPHDALRDGIARLAANALPPADAPPGVQQAALEKLFAEVPAGVALYSAQRERIAAINGLPSTLTLPADRTQSGRMFMLSGPPQWSTWAIKLNDGRWLMVQPQAALGRPRLGVLLMLALMAEACAQYDIATFDGEPVTLRGDARLLKRMVRNLLENAQRHGAPPIAVALGMNTGKVEIKVCDQGPGVPDAERERVFEPFYRRVGANEGGVGLGLALVRQIARRHGGDALAQGNCFTVQLPL